MLRREGKSLRQIKAILGPMSNTTLNNLLRGEPLPPERAGPGYAESRRRISEGVRRYWDTERQSGDRQSSHHYGRRSTDGDADGS